MTNTLAGYDRDFEMTNAFKLLGEENFQILYGQIPDSLYPVIPNGTVYNKPLAELIPPETADSLYFKRKDSVAISEDFKPNPENGSNNWAVSGARTKSGQPILANDPHLGLTLPSIWYEIQIHTPNYNAYGVSFPGLPGVVIGFNDSIAFGFTNAGRDVKDYYEIQFKDQQKQQYLFNNQWVSTQRRIEKIKIKDAQTFMDTVAYTVFGPVTYDQSFKNALADNKAYALKWVAHDSSNILKMWLLLNSAHNLNDYVEAITYFNAPGQNMIFASKSGDIAIQQQATFPLRWKDQGLFVMPGFDSSYMWKGYIPMEDNPRSYNPVEGYVSSANQRPADSTYPYFIPGSYEVYRAITINRKLSSMYGITVDDMKSLQNDNYNVFAEMARPILLNYVNRAALDNDQKRFVSLIENWNLKNEPDEMAVVCFENWWDSLQTTVFKDELTFGQNSVLFPEKFVLLEALRRDTSFKFIDNINTPEREDLNTQVTNALKKASMQLRSLQSEDKLKWSKFKNTTVYHLLKNNAPSFARSGLMNGGGKGIVNSTQHDHGPSWRMIVELTTPTIAYGIYPGGQSGNPGSRFYDDFIDDWTKGQYFKLFMMDPVDVKAGKFKWKMSINPA
jgi:penicillin amidase